MMQAELQHGMQSLSVQMRRLRTGKKRSPEALSSASSGTVKDVSGMSGSMGAFGITKAPTTVCKTHHN